jgi:hypothetical protein
MTTPRPSLLDLHPVEALLALLLISVAALHRLVINPPRPIRQPVPYSSAAIAMVAAWDHEPPGSGVISPETFLDAILQAQAIRQPQASAAPAVGIAPGPTVAELRTMARQRGILSAGGRPIHKARRADLLSALGL